VYCGQISFATGANVPVRHSPATTETSDSQRDSGALNHSLATQRIKIDCQRHAPDASRKIGARYASVSHSRLYQTICIPGNKFAPMPDFARLSRYVWDKAHGSMFSACLG